jgi:hypothetical protein
MPERILTYLPPFYRDIFDFVKLAEAESVELDSLEAAVQRLFDDQFAMTASADAVKRRERMLGIQADLQSESLDFRRKRLVNRYSTKPPFTLRYLQEQLDALVGKGMTIVSVDPQNFILYVTTNIENANVFKEVQHTIETIKPANLLYQQNTSLSDDIVFEEHISAQSISWNYKLDGSWKLGEKPFATLGPEVIVK